LHPRRLPRRALRAADPPPAVPVPPVDLRHVGRRQGRLRPREPAAAAAADHGRRRGLPGRAERLPRTARPELLGAAAMTTTTRAPGRGAAAKGAGGAADYLDQRTDTGLPVKNIV